MRPQYTILALLLGCASEPDHAATPSPAGATPVSNVQTPAVVARAATDDSGGADDTGLDCGSPYSHDTDDTDNGGGAGNNDHGSPENRPYDIDSFDNVESCASCHPEHYDEWQGSIHAYAATNPLMWKGSAKIGEEYPDFPAVCVGCHGPIATLTGTIPHDGPITAKDQLSEQAQDGISCTICHKLYDVHDGVNQFSQCDDYYFATLDNPTATTYHANDYSDIHTYALVCRSCHNVENLVETQVEFTYTEWLDANEAAGGTEFEPAIQTCQDCHMPAYQGQAATDGPTRTVHRHTFVGGDVALTPFADSHRQYKAVQDLMKTAGSVAVTPVYTAGMFSDVDVLVTNLIEGHELPSGSAFDREVWVEIYVTDADGNVLLESGTRDENGDLRDEHSALSPSTDFWISNGLSIFRPYLTDENGEETFDFIGAATHVDDQSLLPGEQRYIRYHIDPAPSTSTPLPIDIEVRFLYRPYPPWLLRDVFEMDDTTIDTLPIFEIATDTEVLDKVTE